MNLFHRHADVGKVFCKVILREQFSVSLVCTKTKNKGWFKGLHYKQHHLQYGKKIHLQKNFLLRQECQFLNVEITIFRTATNEITIAYTRHTAYSITVLRLLGYALPFVLSNNDTIQKREMRLVLF